MTARAARDPIPSTARSSAARRSRRTLGAFGLAATLAIGLAGCIVAPVGYRQPPAYGGGPGYPQAPVEGPVVGVAPPPPQYEVVGVAPVAGWIWLGGYWGWQGGRHVWVGGHWSAPVPGHTWVAPRWERVPQGWRHYGGYWRRG